MRVSALSVSAGVTAAMLLAGCGAKQPDLATDPTTSPTTASSSPAPPSPAATTSRAPRTEAELKAALLTLEDLPAGFQEEPHEADDSSKPASSSDPACAFLVQIFNAELLPGAVAGVHAAFSGGQQGPYIEEALDAMTSATEAAAFLDRFAETIKKCKKIRLKLPDAPADDVAVAAVSFPTMGDKTVAIRMTGSGSLEGLEVLQVGAQVGDVLIGMTLLGAGPEDAEGATADAVEKVRKTLGGAATI